MINKPYPPCCQLLIVMPSYAARSKDKLNKLACGLQNSLAVPTDMTQAISIKNMVKEVYDHYGHIDILINNAGQGLDGLIEYIGIKDFRYIIDLNLIGPLIAMQEIVKFRTF